MFSRLTKQAVRAATIDADLTVIGAGPGGYVAAIKAAQEQDIAFRQGLPTNYLSNLGVAYEENEENPERNRFMSKVQSLMGKLFEYAPVDSAVDQMGKRFMHTALPPYLSSQESNRYT